MRHLILALAAALPPAVHAVQDCEIDGQHVNPSNGASTAGKSGLMRCRDRDSGLLQREQTLSAGRYLGLERFYEKGKLAKEHSINENGNVHGLAREFGPAGQVLSETTQDDGRIRGLARRFHANGQLARASFYDAGTAALAVAEFNDKGQLTDLRCGAKPLLAPAADDAQWCGFGVGASRVPLFDNKGQPAGQASWRAGQLVQRTRVDAQGRMLAEEKVDGARQIEREFSTGTLRRERERVMDGREAASELLRQFSESGTLVREQRWTRGQPVSDVQSYLNGQPRRRVEWAAAEGGQLATETDYRDDGRVAAVGRWLEQRGRRQAVGTHQKFNAAGRLVGETIYNERGRPGRERAWDDAGTFLRDDEVFEDGSRKALAR